MSDDIVIRAENVSKRYHISHLAGQGTLRDTMQHMARLAWRRVRWNTRLNREDFWALRDVNFEIKRGDVVGIIGRNGAGKSTLLKVLSRITEPTSGRITLKGRVASLLEVGTGFHPELTGRDNIFLNGAILGMSRVEIRKKFDEIVAFAEVERFLDTPVKRYSSGMYVRLAFSVAAHLEPEILIVDEALAVGDAQFQKKCIGKMESVAHSEGRTIIFVSHNMGVVSSLCSRAIMLAGGQVVAQGPTQEVVAAYNKATNTIARSISLEGDHIKRRGDARARFSSAALLDEAGQETASIIEGQVFSIELGVVVSTKLPVSIISITLVDSNQQDVHTTMHYDSLDMPVLSAGLHRFRVTFRPNFLARGTYNVRLACFGPNFHEHDHIHHAFSIEVGPSLDDRDAIVSRPGVVKWLVPWKVIDV